MAGLGKAGKRKEAGMTDTVKIKASKLVMDYTIYPREQIRSYHVSQIAEALEAGAKLPPIVADKKSQRITDGFHRFRAYQKVFGSEAEIPVIFKAYQNEGEMFLDAVALNATHGRNLTPFDRARVLVRAEELKIETPLIAKALNMTPERLGELKVSRLGYLASKPVILKRTVAHLAGEDLTEKQAEYNRLAGGMNQTFYINQVIGLLESDAVDWEDEKVVKALKRLHYLLDEALKPVGA
jgi:hypothetical protein